MPGGGVLRAGAAAALLLPAVDEVLALHALAHVQKAHAHFPRAEGGYGLSRPPERITMADIMGITEDGLGLLECIVNGLSCDRADSCRSIEAWRGLQRVINDYLSSQTLRDLAERDSL